VRDAGIGVRDLVVEIGAGDGRLTAALAAHASRVIAVELDPAFVGRLRARFDGVGNVEIVHGDIRTVGLPAAPFRAFGNIPFGVTNAVLRRLLDDPRGPLTRADLIVQHGAARKRAEPWPSTVLGLVWLPWWELTLSRRIPRTGFDPPPAVDAAVLHAQRRRPALLDVTEKGRFERLVRHAFERPTWPIARALRDVLPPLTWKRFARDRGLPLASTPRQLDVWDWVALFPVLRPATIRARRATPRGSVPR
jgi:23S rRNA (adenine-N6)-dimethyltransferase